MPPDIVKLINLKVLDLSSNQLSSLPIDIEKLRQSTNIAMRGNPLPPHILEEYEPR
ncbi:leucine-rich repeat domain-containing protein [Acaryochloris sp. 'Moss Beach']|uniref:leucine-rich repeat domain-containing protein n=1 Tax=Acaryochloris sp. 'Moss Beach' TaxID=2740837 RepID=UPI001F3C9904|nr:leucine-rich repeat domain-containing protein [Acaryochloris sp. 'Moss Beach']